MSCTASVAQALDLEISHRIVSLGEDGVKRTVEFKENMYRRADHIWIERVLPAGSGADHDHDEAQRVQKHLDAAKVPRWLVRGHGDEITLRLVDRREKRTYSVAPADYPNVGFNGAWDAAYFLVDPKSLADMAPGAMQDGARWYEKKAGGAVLRILWDREQRYPRVVDHRRIDGRESKRTTLTRIARPATEPWHAATKFTPRDYTDLLD